MLKIYILTFFVILLLVGGCTSKSIEDDVFKVTLKDSDYLLKNTNDIELYGGESAATSIIIEGNITLEICNNGEKITPFPIGAYGNIETSVDDTFVNRYYMPIELYSRGQIIKISPNSCPDYIFQFNKEIPTKVEGVNFQNDNSIVLRKKFKNSDLYLNLKDKKLKLNGEDKVTYDKDILLKYENEYRNQQTSRNKVYNREITDTETDKVESKDNKKIVATVNGEEITQEEVLSLQQQLQQQRGTQVSEQQALDQVILEKVLFQVISKQNYEITNEEAEARLKEELSLQGLTIDEFKQNLQSEEETFESTLEYYKETVAIDRYLSEVIDSDDLSEDEKRIEYIRYIESLVDKADIKYFNR